MSSRKSLVMSRERETLQASLVSFMTHDSLLATHDSPPEAAT